ncbi:MAG TPA: hypothetical protein VHT27_11370 [Solirubrobacteraceae bacterium]|jgi:hypothetical protein|nr:hypothetical protein [Solirubrobacteraceae bacterium]
MPSAGEIRQQLSFEIARRNRLAVPAFAGGVLYLLSSIIISATLNGAPTVGLLQGLAPAFSGVADPRVSPRAEEVKFISHHAGPLIGGSVIAAIAVAVLTLVLLLLVKATRFRRPETFARAGQLVLAGGIAFAAISVAHQVVTAIETHKFATGHDFSSHAVEQALTKGTANQIVVYLATLSGLALAAGTIIVCLGAQRVGLLPRWMGILGIFTGLLIFFPIGGAQLQIVPAFWMVMMGILLIGRWPGGDPPAWGAGEARPWPTAADQRAARQAAATPATATAGAAEPARPTSSRAQKRRQRRKGRGGRTS